MSCNPFIKNSSSFITIDSKLESNQIESNKVVEVIETGKAVKVQSDIPHLVSFGADRFSTDVTLIPLSKGMNGSSYISDFGRKELSAKDNFCLLENINDEITLHPLSETITVDGLQVTTPIKLSQGSMICLGKGNYFRFNHPKEAKLMRSIIPENILLELFPDVNSNELVNSKSNNCNNLLLTSENRTSEFATFTTQNVYASGGSDSYKNSLTCCNHLSNSLSLDHVPTLYSNKEELYLSEKNLEKQRQKRKEAEKEMKEEKQRLEDIISICAEYEQINKMQISKSSDKSLSTSNTIQPNRIKTNGSLPLESRFSSNGSSPCHQSFSSSISDNNNNKSILMHSSSDELGNIFDHDDSNLYSRISYGSCYSPLLNSFMLDDRKSPYENVALLPSSPRTKIKTFIHKDKMIPCAWTSKKTTDDEINNSIYVKTDDQKSISVSNNYHDSGTNNDYLQILSNISNLKSQATILMEQLEEIIKELELEQALLGNEQIVLQRQLEIEEDKLQNLLEDEHKLMKEIDDKYNSIQPEADKCRERICSISSKLMALNNELSEENLSLCSKTNLQNQIKLQQENLETEKKLQTRRETQREEHRKAIEDQQKRISMSNQQHTGLKTSLSALVSQAQKDTEKLDQKRRERQRLAKFDLCMFSTERNDSSVDGSTDSEWDTQEKHINEQLSKLRQVVRSEDDIQRCDSVIHASQKSGNTREEFSSNQVMSCSDSSPIIEEKHNISDLKKRIQDEVQNAWEQRHNLAVEDTDEKSSWNDYREGKLSRYTSPVNSDGNSLYSEPPEVHLRQRDRAALQQRPLTRYLPIRSDVFDLRQHIESSGHQIELCHHVTLDSYSCRGYLHKLGSHFRSWRRRWFVLDRHCRALLYYSDHNEGKSIEEVYVDHLQSVRSPNPKVTFCVKTVERLYYFMAPSPEAMRIWVDVIFTGAEGYQEYQS